LPGEGAKIPDDQKIAAEAEAVDELQFLFQLSPHRAADAAVTLLRAEERHLV